MTEFTPVTALAGGVLIGLASLMLLALNGRIAGISGILHGLHSHVPGDRGWRVAFLLGLLAAGFLWQVFAVGAPTGPVVDTAGAVGAGLLVGFGTRMASGCTSGHGVCGLGRFSIRSLAAVMTFMLVAAITVYVTRHIAGSGA